MGYSMLSGSVKPSRACIRAPKAWKQPSLSMRKSSGIGRLLRCFSAVRHASMHTTWLA